MLDPQSRAVPGSSPEGDLAALYRTHADTVARWAARLGGPDIDVHDVVQEVFLVASRRLPRFTGEAKPTTWLYRTTEKVVQTWRRKRRWRRWLTESPSTASDELVAGGPTPIEVLERRRAIDTLYEILGSMPQRYRNVLILFELEGLGSDQIAELLAARASTVRVWLHRARAMFVQRLASKKEAGR